MTHDQNDSESAMVDSLLSRVLVTVVRLIMFPILILGFVVWGIALVGSMAMSSAIGGVTYAVRGLRAHRVIAFPTGGSLRRDIDLGRPELIERHPLG